MNLTNQELDMAESALPHARFRIAVALTAAGSLLGLHAAILGGLSLMAIIGYGVALIGGAPVMLICLWKLKQAGRLGEVSRAEQVASLLVVLALAVPLVLLVHILGDLA